MGAAIRAKMERGRVAVVFAVLVVVCQGKLFTAKPDVPGTWAETLDDVTCTFTYAVNGGSSEDWIIEVEKDDRGDFMCLIGRPNPPTYLFFNSFEVKITGGDIDQVAVHHNSGELPESSTYIVDLKTNRVRNRPEFSGTVAAIEVAFYQ